MSKLNKDNLSNKNFGIPELRKYPLNDKEHVIKALQMFHYCPLEYKKKLAHNINRKAKEYNITISQSSKIYDYLNETEQLEIDLMEDIYLMEENLYLNEAFGMNESEAKGSVDVAISLWKKRKNFIKTDKDKQKLLSDIKAEKSAISSMQNRNDFNGILIRAKDTSKNMSKKIESGDYQKIKNIKGKSELNSGDPKRLGKVLAVGGTAIATGATVGGMLGKKSANNHANGNIMTKAKVGGGALAGGAIGSLVGGMGITATLAKQSSNKKQANDPNKPLRQHAERYANFINNFQGEILELTPSGQNQTNENGGDD